MSAAEGFESADTFYQNGAAHPANDGSVKEAAVEPEPAIGFIAHDDLFSVEPKNENLVVPELGIGAGPPIGFFGQGFVGKTIMSMALGMAVALGKQAWGRFAVRQGTWVHFDYEQGRRETKKRVQRLATGFGIGKEELRDRMKVAIYPSVNLTTTDAVKHYIEAMTGATIATIDALKGITPGVEENSSSMRDYMRILSVASEETGCAVILIHHAGKTDPKKARKEMGRGSSAIYDECQSVFVVTGDKDEDKRVTHEKDRELGETAPEFGLRFEDIEDDMLSDDAENVSPDLCGTGRGLRVVVVSGVQEQQMDRIVRYLTSSGGAFQGSKSDLVKALEMNRSDFFKAIGTLVQLKRVRVEGKSAKESRPDGRISLIADDFE